MISLLFFVLDHYRFYELKDKVKASAYLIASMIQQLANTRTNKQLTKQDLNRIVYASSFNFFHINSMFNPWPFGVYISVCFWHLKRENSNNYKYHRWLCSTGGGGKTFSENGMWNDPLTSQNKSLTDVQKLHPDLVCNTDGDEKLLISVSYGITNATKFTKSKLGFFILEPDCWRDFTYKIIITPKPGLFPPSW